MAGELTAQFELQLLDQMSSPLQKILQRIEDLTARLEGIAEATTGSEAANRSLTEMERTTGHLTETMQSAVGVSGELSEALGATAGAGEAASGGLGAAIGEMAVLDERASASIGVLGRLKSALSGVGESGHGSRFGGALHSFHENWEKTQSRGFGALMGGFELLEPAKEAAEYDNTIRHVGIGLEIHGADLDKYVAAEKIRINELARNTGQSGGELAEALGFFSREGFRGQELESSLATTAKIATAYNAKPEAVAKTAFALKENLGIDDKHLQGALASLAIDGKNADLPFEKVAPLLPELAAAAGSLGIKGRSGVDDLAAAIGVIRKSTGNDGEAFTRGMAFLQTVTSRHGLQHWGRVFKGENLFDFEDKARKNGIDPMVAVINKIKFAVDHARNKEIVLSNLFGNQYDTGAIRAILDHWPQFSKIRKKVAGADQQVIDRDYADGKKSGLISVQKFEESLMELLKRIGDDFTPILNGLTVAVNFVNECLEWMDKHCHGLTVVLIGLVGLVIAAVTVITGLGAVIGLASVAFGAMGVILGLVSWPVVLVIVGLLALVVVLVLLWKNSDKVKQFFQDLGDQISAFIDRLKHMWPRNLHDFLSGRDDHSHYDPVNTLQTQKEKDQQVQGFQSWYAEQIRHFNKRRALGSVNAKLLKTYDHQHPKHHSSVISKTKHYHHHHVLAHHAQPSGHRTEPKERTVKIRIEAEKGLKVSARSDHSSIQVDHGPMMVRP